MVNSRTLEVNGKSFLIYDHDIQSSLTDGSGSYDLSGICLSDCAISLGYYLPIYARHHPLDGKSVIEIGAGTGFTGIVSSTLGARVTLTDLPLLLPGLLHNIEANSNIQCSGVQAKPLVWGNDMHLKDLGDSTYDLVLMSDVLYKASDVPDLCRTLKGLIHGRSEILLAYELRFGTTDCFRILREEGFGWEKVDNRELDPVWQSDDIGIFRVYGL